MDDAEQYMTTSFHDYGEMLHVYELSLTNGDDGSHYREYLDELWYRLSDREKDSAPRMKFRTMG